MTADEGKDHDFFKNQVTYLTLGISLQALRNQMQVISKGIALTKQQRLNPKWWRSIPRVYPITVLNVTFVITLFQETGEKKQQQKN